MHQYKVNAKAAFDGEVWQWHQDYGTWARDDGMPEPRAMNIAVFLDEVSAINGPLMFIPGSHREGVLRGRPRPGDHLLPAVDARPGDDHPAGRAGRHRRADRQARLGADVPRQPGARLARPTSALSAGDRLPVAVRGRQPHPPASPAARVDRAPRLHADRAGGRRLRCCATLAPRPRPSRPMNLHRLARSSGPPPGGRSGSA